MFSEVPMPGVQVYNRPSAIQVPYTAAGRAPRSVHWAPALLKGNLKIPHLVTAYRNTRPFYDILHRKFTIKQNQAFLNASHYYFCGRPS